MFLTFLGTLQIVLDYYIVSRLSAKRKLVNYHVSRITGINYRISNGIFANAGCVFLYSRHYFSVPMNLFNLVLYSKSSSRNPLYYQDIRRPRA